MSGASTCCNGDVSDSDFSLTLLIKVFHDSASCPWVSPPATGLSSVWTGAVCAFSLGGRVTGVCLAESYAWGS